MAEQETDRTTKDMEERLEHLEEDIEDARRKAPDAVPGDELGGVSGDVSEESGGPMFGEDPEGAVDDDA